MSRTRHLLFLAVLLDAFFAVTSQTTPVFVSQPQSVNISDGDIAVFTCVFTPDSGVSNYWNINGKGLHKFSNHNITPHMPDISSPQASYQLSVLGQQINDNITIGCLLLPFHGTAVSSSLAYLRVQGKLEVVKDVQLVQYNSTALQLSFTPPFTLAGVPISNYSIAITSADGATNTTITATTTDLIYTPPDICTSYQFNITANNRVGIGASYLINQTIYKAPEEFWVDSTLVFSPTTPTSIQTFQVDMKCIATRPSNISIIVNNSLGSVVSLNCPLRLPQPTIDCQQILSFSQTNTLMSVMVNVTKYLMFGGHYTAVVALENEAGVTESDTIQISTFHVQNVTTRVFQNTHCVTCWFAQGTTAIGCHISFTDTMGNRVQETVAHRLGSSLSASDCTGDLPPGVYRIMVSDINSSDVVDHRIAAVGNSLITVTEKPSLQLTTSITTDRSLSTPLFPSSTTAVLSLSSMVSATVRLVGAPDRTAGGDLGLLLPLIVTVVGITVLATCVIMIMIACLVRYRGKAKKHKIAEVNAKRKQKELEEAASCSELSSSPLSLTAPPLVADPLYDEVATRQVFAIQQCPAYAPLPPPRV